MNTTIKTMLLVGALAMSANGNVATNSPLSPEEQKIDKRYRELEAESAKATEARDTEAVLRCSREMRALFHGDRCAEAVYKLHAASTEEERFYALDAAAKESLAAGKTDEARQYAEELAALIDNYHGNWNYGNAVQDAHLVLGRLALATNDVVSARNHLLAAGKSPGSPQMDSFGPNMSLAKALLEKGEKDVVIEYFNLCRKFWKLEGGRLDAWTENVKRGEMPDFGANLVY